MQWKSLWEVFRVSLKLGLTSFGGPIAHLGYFREEYVLRRKWMDEKSYADLVGLCQFLPGPASSQVGMGIGLMRAGIPGAAAAWIGFTMPSVLLLIFFALLYQAYDIANAGWIHGLKVGAAAIVAQAVWGMGRNLAPDRLRASFAIASACILLTWHSAFAQVGVIAAAGLAGIFIYRREAGNPSADHLPAAVSRKTAIAALGLFFILLVFLPLGSRIWDNDWIRLIDGFYRSGALVFGGGHVVLPLLEKVTVPAGWTAPGQFLAGYAAAQAVPGPLFTFASYLGMIAKGWLGAAAGTLAIFLPAFLLVVGTLPFWNSLRAQPKAQGALKGINAAVVGVLLAALYDPVFTSSISRPSDFALAIVLFGLLVFWKLPPWVVIAAAAAGGMVLSMI